MDTPRGEVIRFCGLVAKDLEDSTLLFGEPFIVASRETVQPVCVVERYGLVWERRGVSGVVTAGGRQDLIVRHPRGR